jgi:hypothetical protein
LTKTVKITVDKDLHDEFMQTVVFIEGFKKGRRRISAEKAMKLYMNYAKPYKNKRLFEVAHKKNLQPWELGEILIERFMMIHTDLGLDIDFLTNDEHFKIVVEYLKRYKPD